MRKMYFAMIPKRSLLENAAILAAVAAGVVFGGKWLLGEEKFNQYKDKLTGTVKSGVSELSSRVRQKQPLGPDTGAGINDEETDVLAREEDAILERIRRASQK